MPTPEQQFNNVKKTLAGGPKLIKDLATDLGGLADIAPNNANPADIADFGNYLDTKYGNFYIGPVDVIKDYNWGITKSSQLKLDEVPSMELVEFQPSNGPVLESALYGIRTGAETASSTLSSLQSKVSESASKVLGAFSGSKGDSVALQKAISDEAIRPKLEDNRKNAYVDTYTGISTGNVYTLPFFSTYNHSMSVNWDAQDGALSKLLGEDLTQGLAMGGSIVSNAYIGVTKRQQFKGVGDISFETSFQLFNTLSRESDPKKTILKNYKLIYALLFNNMVDKLTMSTFRPPVIYSMTIPGVRVSPAVYISNMIVENIGQVNKVSLKINGNDIDVNVPDAWNVQLVITEMMPESRNIFNGVIDSKNKVRVIKDIRG